MKIFKFAIILILLLSSNILSAIEIVSVKPERPAVGDEVFLNVFFTGEEVARDGRIASISIEQNKIEVVASLSDAISGVNLPDKTESVSLGEIPAGEYLVSLSVVALFGSPGLPSIIQTFTFSVSDSISVSSPNSIPTLGEYSMILLSMLLGLAGFGSYTKKNSYW